MQNRVAPLSGAARAPAPVPFDCHQLRLPARYRSGCSGGSRHNLQAGAGFDGKQSAHLDPVRVKIATMNTHWARNSKSLNGRSNSASTSWRDQS